MDKNSQSPKLPTGKKGQGSGFYICYQPKQKRYPQEVNNVKIHAEPKSYSLLNSVNLVLVIPKLVMKVVYDIKKFD